jgi:hypothetical protein
MNLKTRLDGLEKASGKGLNVFIWMNLTAGKHGDVEYNGTRIEPLARESNEDFYTRVKEIAGNVCMIRWLQEGEACESA